MIIKRILLIFIILLLLFPTANATILNLVVGDTIYPTRKHVSSLHKTIELDEVQVIGQRKLFSIRKDTTFINTDCLRVRKGANLEDLIRNIPGMEYDKANRQLSFKGIERRKHQWRDLYGQRHYRSVGEYANRCSGTTETV